MEEAGELAGLFTISSISHGLGQTVVAILGKFWNLLECNAMFFVCTKLDWHLIFQFPIYSPE